MHKHGILALSTPLLLFAIPGNGVAEPRGNVYIQHNLVSDLPEHAEHRDRNLVNPWGIAFGPMGPFWIADNHTGVSTLYDERGNALPAGSPLVVKIPPPGGSTSDAAPTGIAFNGSTSFVLGDGKPALFIFATEDGTISAWNLDDASQAELKVDNSSSGAVYKGLALGSSGGGTFLYATNFHAGRVDVFDGNFAPAMPGTFQDPTIPAGFAPFGIQNVGGRLLVTYAKQDADKHDDEAGAGNGFVNVFDTNGTLIQRLISAGPLNSPWGLAMAPAGFGDFGNSLLVGNFGDGTIHAFDPQTGVERGQLLRPSGRPLVIQGLWGLIFGGGGLDGEPGILYFTAGIPGPGAVEDHGLFGQIRPQHGDDDEGDGDKGKGHDHD